MMMRDKEKIDRLLEQVRTDGRAATAKATQEEKETALKIATAEVDRICRFKGRKLSPEQALSWPRADVTDKAGNAVVGVPSAVTEAVYFLASAYLAGYRIAPDNRDHARALVAAILGMLDGLLDPDNPTQDAGPLH